MKDGDSPDTIVITYGRCNAALEMVQDLMQVIPVAEWQSLARQMLDRDLLSDDEWWAALQRRRRRIAGRPIKPSDLPSYATRMTAGHFLLAAWLGDQHTFDSMSDPIACDYYHASGRIRKYEYAEAAAIAWARSGGYCEADGLHHKNCPGDLIKVEHEAVTHHVYPREVAKREGLKGDPLIDHPGNLLVVWNGHGSGAGGCHGRIHTERSLARDLGHLARSLAHVAPGPY